MAKILLSPLGVGSRNKDDQAERRYRPANYQIDGKSYQKSFIASALDEHFKFDGIIFVGTVKSMWEEVYQVFSEESKIEIDEEYYLELAEKVETLNHQSSLEELNLQPINQALGDRSKCLLIKYGLNEPEIQENLDIILSIIEDFQEGDEIYIDITHSFRSLSLFLFLVLMFVSDLVKEKNIKIQGIYYGMLDITTEMSYTPVVNLQSLFDLTQWIKGAYSLQEFGNGYLISQLLQREGEENLANRIKQLSDIININYLPNIKQSSVDLKGALKQSPAKSPFKYLKGILEKFIEQFTKQERECDFQLRLAKWSFDNKRYATGYITLTEAIITYLCEIYNKDPISEKERNNMKDLLHQSENKNSELSQIYFQINPIRKSIAHALIDQKRESYTSAINNAEQVYQNTKRIFKTGTLGQNKR